MKHLELAWEVSGSPYAIRTVAAPHDIVIYLQQLDPVPDEALAQRIVDDHNDMLRPNLARRVRELERVALLPWSKTSFHGGNYADLKRDPHWSLSFSWYGGGARLFCNRNGVATTDIEVGPNENMLTAATRWADKLIDRNPTWDGTCCGAGGHCDDCENEHPIPPWGCCTCACHA